jgi:hypothetical protein
MERIEFLNEFDRASLEWKELIRRVPLDRYSEPGAAGEWTLKDVVAHIAWHENEMIGILQQHSLEGSPWWSLPLHGRNRKIYELNQGHPVEAVLAQAQQVHADLDELLHQITNEDLNDPARFTDMPVEDRPWQYFVTNTYEHYRDHIPEVEKWLGKNH